VAWPGPGLNFLKLAGVHHGLSHNVDMSLIRFQRRRTWLATAASAGFAAVAAPLASWAPMARAQFRIEISGVGARQIPVAVAPLRGEERAPQQPSAIVRADLQRSGLIAAGEWASPLDERAALNAAEWRARGFDAVVGGSATRLADGRWELRARLFDAVKGEELLQRTRVVLEADLRLAAHRIADDVFEALTGERGVFATRVAYVMKGARQHSLHVADADGQNGQVALSSAESIISPAWSPDGRALAYVSFESQKATVWVQDVASGQRRVVADFRGSNSAPAWAPDGRTLAVALSRDGLTQLFLTSRDGGTPQRLTTSLAIDTEPVFAPDGRSLYFVSDRGGGPQIYRVPLGAGVQNSAERVSFSGPYNISPALSPDGKHLAYITRQGGAFRVAVQELASGSVSVISDTQDDESPSFAPNGRLLLYASRAQGRDVLMTSTLDGRIKTRLVTTGGDLREPAWGPFNPEPK
jgi:TolB protein